MMDEPPRIIDTYDSDMKKYKITFRSPGSAMPRFMLPLSLLKQEKKSQIVEAVSLEEAERMAADERLRYPLNWFVSVEELSE